MSVNEKGFVGIGSTYQDSVRLFTVTDALTISHSGDINSSGTIAIREQASPPLSNSKFGKIYVRPRIIEGQTQSLYFLDDGGNEFDLVNSKFDYFLKVSGKNMGFIVPASAGQSYEGLSKKRS